VCSFESVLVSALLAEKLMQGGIGLAACAVEFAVVGIGGLS
jgi:hypothetical protein